MGISLGLVVAGCSGTLGQDIRENDPEAPTRPTDDSEDEIALGRKTVKYSFDAKHGAFPEGTSFLFTNYPSAEDADAKAQTRTKKLAADEAALQKSLGREGLLSEWFQSEASLPYSMNDLGYWLNDRFEKVVATDASPALVISHFNHSDDMSTNLIFKIDAAQLLRPNTKYTMKSTLVLRTNAPVGCNGVGGSPDGVEYLIAFSKTPVQREADQLKFWRLTNRKSNGAGDFGALDPDRFAGTPLRLGNIGAPKATDCAKWNAFQDVTLGKGATQIVTTDASGTLYGVLSSHSGFEGTSVWAVKSLDVTLTPKR